MKSSYLRPCADGCGRMTTGKRCPACYQANWRAKQGQPLPVVLRPVGAGPLRFWLPA